MTKRQYQMLLSLLSKFNSHLGELAVKYDTFYNQKLMNWCSLVSKVNIIIKYIYNFDTEGDD